MTKKTISKHLKIAVNESSIARAKYNPTNEAYWLARVKAYRAALAALEG